MKNNKIIKYNTLSIIVQLVYLLVLIICMAFDGLFDNSSKNGEGSLAIGLLVFGKYLTPVFAYFVISVVSTCAFAVLYGKWCEQKKGNNHRENISDIMLYINILVALLPLFVLLI